MRLLVALVAKFPVLLFEIELIATGIDSGQIEEVVPANAYGSNNDEGPGLGHEILGVSHSHAKNDRGQKTGYQHIFSLHHIFPPC